MPFQFRRHRHVGPVAIAEARIAAPLAKLEERIVDASSTLDSLVSDLGEVAALIRDVAAQVALQAGGDGDD